MALPTTACVCAPGLRHAIGAVALWDVAMLKAGSRADVPVSEWGEGVFRVWRECGWQTWRVLGFINNRHIVEAVRDV